MRNLLVIYFLLLSACCFGQANDFSAQFKADSLGTFGFRKKAVVFDTIKRVWLINGKNLIGYKRKKVLQVLGKPNRIDTVQDKTINLEYTVYYNSISSMYLEIFFKQDRVTRILGGYNNQSAVIHGIICGGSGPAPPTSVIEVLGLQVTAKIKGKDTTKFNTDTIKLQSIVDIRKYLQEHMQYPEIEKEAHITGTVYLSFIVGRDSSVTDVKILRKIPGGPGLDKEAVRALIAMPKLILPYREKGRRMAVICVIPIRFELR